MRSWLFRNRLRLRAIYGPRLAPPSVGTGETAEGPSRRSRAPMRAHTTVERHGRRIVLRTRP
jgi:hypothetical protein